MNDNILPLFTNYLHDYCFSQSLIGKIGIIGDYADIQQAQEIIKLEAKKYTPTENQKNIKNSTSHSNIGQKKHLYGSIF